MVEQLARSASLSIKDALVDHTILVPAESFRGHDVSEKALSGHPVTIPTGSGLLADAHYGLSLKWDDDAGLADLVRYLAEVVAWMPVTVVDGSAEELFAAHRRALPDAVEMVPPEPWQGRNGKVAGVMTGVRRAGEERIVVADDDVRHFGGQRVRQAYDDFAQPARLLAELSLLPLLSWAVRHPHRLAAVGVAVCGVAEIGRRRAQGARAFPAGTVLWAPLWVLERSVCVWAAVALRARGGVSYAGSRLRTAGHSRSTLRRRLRGRSRKPLPLLDAGPGPERSL